MSVKANLNCEHCGTTSTFVFDYEAEAFEIEYCPHCGQPHDTDFEFSVEGCEE